MQAHGHFPQQKEAFFQGFSSKFEKQFDFWKSISSGWSRRCTPANGTILWPCSQKKIFHLVLTSFFFSLLKFVSSPFEMNPFHGWSLISKNLKVYLVSCHLKHMILYTLSFRKKKLPWNELLKWRESCSLSYMRATKRVSVWEMYLLSKL